MSQRLDERTVCLALPAYCVDTEGAGFYAVTVDMTLAGLRLRGTRVPRRGDQLGCRIRNVDAFDAQIVGASDIDFTVRVGGRHPGAIAKQLMNAAGRSAAGPVRVAPRLVPDVTSTVVALPDGRTFQADIANISASGAAIRTAMPIEPGSAIVLGSTPATVARRFEGGFGVVFLQPFPPESVDRSLVL